MIAVRQILLGTLILSASLFDEAFAEVVANSTNEASRFNVSKPLGSQDNQATTSAFERFRPGSAYSFSGSAAGTHANSATGRGTATGPSSRYQAAQHSANQHLADSRPQQPSMTNGRRHLAYPIVQHDLKPSLSNELRIAPKTFQKIDDAKTTLPDFETPAQSTSVVISEPNASSKKPPAQPMVDPLIEKLNRALSTKPVEAIETESEEKLTVSKAANLEHEEDNAKSVTTAAATLSSDTLSLSTSHTPDDSDTRKLGFSSTAISSGGERASSPFSEMLAWRPSSNSLITMGSGLAIVLGLVMIAGWIARKSMPRSARVLPNEVAEVLGRVVLSSRQTAQLVKLGNKLILVSVTADGAETLTEVEDPEEVQRLLQLSEEASGRGSNAEFERVFQQLTNGPAADGFLGEEAPAYDDPRYKQDPRQQNPDNVHYDAHYDAQRLAAAYANTPGGRTHAA